jgi:DNA invertase Pin-like site-specific DNA recombinase
VKDYPQATSDELSHTARARGFIMNQPFTPVAQYLRMSTEHQQYSLANQIDAIRTFCNIKSYSVVKTYKDPGRSGLTLKRRPGLIELLKDVVDRPIFRAVVVYDVSRWGRFQDVDESAHYEFICRSAGVPVLYCAESFSPEMSLADSVLKSLKRIMAAEYSRELGEKCYRGQRRLIELGFKAGGTAPFGFRRLLVKPDGTPLQILNPGEKKAIHEQKVVLVQGPSIEVETVRKIFAWYASGKMDAKKIAAKLYRDGPPFTPGAYWTRDAVDHILRDPKYYGCNVWGRTSRRLQGKVNVIAEKDWVIKDDAFQPIIKKDLFERAKAKRLSRYWSDDRLLQGLRDVLAEEGAITQEILGQRVTGPKIGTLANHFGNLQNALDLIGYRYRKNYELARRMGEHTQKLHRSIIEKLNAQSPRRLSIFIRPWSRRWFLRLDGKFDVSVQICRTVRTRSNFFWRIVPRRSERGNVTLCCFMDESNTKVRSMAVARNLAFATSSVNVRPGDRWMKRTIPIKDLRGFCNIAIKLERNFC